MREVRVHPASGDAFSVRVVPRARPAAIHKRATVDRPPAGTARLTRSRFAIGNSGRALRPGKRRVADRRYAASRRPTHVDRILVDLRAIAADRDAGDLLEYVTGLQLHTEEGRAVLHVDFSIPEARGYNPDPIRLPGAFMKHLRLIVSGAALAVMLAGTSLTGRMQQAAPSAPAAPFDALHFRSIGPATMSGRIADLAVYQANPAIFYVATAHGGVWKTTSNGTTFYALFQDLRPMAIGDVTMSQIES